jgi:predicted O-methyltransferase YrrM
MKRLLADIDRRTLAKALRNPRRALLRLVLRSRLTRRTADRERHRLLTFLSQRYGVDGEALLTEYRRSAFREWFVRRRAELERYAGPYRLGTTGDFGCEALYLLVRSARPSSIVETGVLYGASSAHLLAALARNGEGSLHSIETGRDAREPHHEHFVPEDLRGRWHLIIGDSRRELTEVLARLSPIDMFYHDSLHTRDHMHWEFRTALPHLGPAGILASDDVLNPPSVRGIFRAGPFFGFCGDHRIPHLAFHNLGIAWPGGSQATRERAA